MMTAEEFDAICLDAIICDGGDAYIVEKVIEHFDCEEEE